jgi:hypothetical protein
VTLLRNVVRWFTYHTTAVIQPTPRPGGRRAAIAYTGPSDLVPTRRLSLNEAAHTPQRRSLNEAAHKQRVGVG